MSSNRWRWTVRGAVAILGVVLLGYTAFRAHRLSFTFDESWTYLSFVAPGPRTAFDCYDANNHFLNTLLMIVTSRVFGAGHVALRLPNLLAHAVYLFATWLVVKRLRHPAMVLAGFVLLNLNPCLLEFFSLARGYGLAAAFVVLSVCAYLPALTAGEGDRSAAIRAFSFAALGALANLPVLDYYAALLAFHVGAEWRRTVKEDGGTGRGALMSAFVRRLTPLWKHVLLHMLVLLPLAINLRVQGALYFGGRDGFWADTVGSLIRGVYYGAPVGPVALLSWKLFVGIVLLAAAWAMMAAVRRGFAGDVEPLRFALFVLVLAAAVSVAQRYLLGVPFLKERSALFLFPLFMIVVVFLCDLVLRQSPAAARAAAGALCGVLIVGMVYAAARSANLTHTVTWKQDADTVAILGDLDRDRCARGLQRVRVTASWVLEPAMNFYRTTRRLGWLAPVEPGAWKSAPDYYCYRPEDAGRMSALRQETVRHYERSGNTLARAVR